MKLIVKSLFCEPGYGDIITEIASLSTTLDYHFIASVERKCSEAVFIKSIMPDNFEGEAWVVTEAGVLKGLLCLEPLAWDSEILGYPAFKITRMETFNSTSLESEEVLAALLSRPVSLLKSLARSHCHIRIPVDAVDMQNSLAKAGFGKIERLNVYGAHLSDIRADLDTYSSGALETRLLQPDDIEWACQLSAEAVNPYDRFHADPLLAGSADDFMQAWIKGCTSGFCDSNFIGLSEGRRAGFALWQSGKKQQQDLGLQIAKFVLTAVSSQFSGQGFLKQLTARGCQHFAQQGADWVVMSTQKPNVAAVRSMTALGWGLLHQEETWSAGFSS